MIELGFGMVPPGAEACGPIIDRPPAGGGDVVRAYEAWVRAAQAELAARVGAGDVKIWVPVRLPSAPVVPLFGGDPATDWVEAVGVLALLGQRAGRSIQIVDLSDVGTVSRLHDTFETRFPGDYRAEAIGVGGNVDPLAGLGAGQVAAVLADVFRAEDDRRGRNAAAMFRTILANVVGCLEPSRGIDVLRVQAAVEFAQFAMSSGPAVLDAGEEQELLQRVHARAQASRPLSEGLFELANLVAVLADFAPSGAPTRRSGNPRHGAVTVTSVAGRMGAGRELATDLVAARAAESVGRVGADVVVVVGADRASARSLDAIADAAEHARAHLVVFFERLTDGSSDRLGWRGSPVAGFFRLANPRDAALAADFLGKRHRFVLSGTSQTEGRSFEWGWSAGTSTSTDRSTSHSWQMGRNFSRTTSSALSRSSSTSNTRTQSQGTNSSHSTSFERVYEHLLDPSVFQQLDAGALLLLDVRTSSARLASCHRDVARSKLVGWSHLLEIAD